MRWLLLVVLVGWTQQVHGAKWTLLSDFEVNLGQWSLDPATNAWERVTNMVELAASKVMPPEGDYMMAYKSGHYAPDSNGTLTGTNTFSGPEICVKMNWIMQGVKNGMLEILVQNKTTNAIVMHLFKADQNVDDWQMDEEISIEPLDSSYILLVVGTSGTGGFMAVDNIRYRDGPCSLPDGFQSFYTSFEEEVDGFESQGAGEWIRTNYMTPTMGTGPFMAFRDNWFVYVNADATPNGQETHLVTKVAYEGDDDMCVEFAYHFDGADAGTLKLDVAKYESQAATQRETIWSQGTVQIGWVKQQVTIPPKDWPYVILFSVVASGPKGDVALDDIFIGKAPCKTMTVGIDCLPCNSTRTNFAGCRVANDNNIPFCKDVGHAPDGIANKRCTMNIVEGWWNNTKEYHQRCVATQCDDGSGTDVNTLLYQQMCSDASGNDCDVCCPTDCLEPVRRGAAPKAHYSALAVITGTILGVLYTNALM